ncbi:MAG: hypothetical protein U0996_06790 [Planctomycetaceae bacterium]
MSADHFLTGGSVEAVYADVARRLQMSEGALRVAVHRLRERFRDLLRQEVADRCKRAGCG